MIANVFKGGKNSVDLIINREDLNIVMEYKVI